MKIKNCIKCGEKIGPFASYVWEARKLSGIKSEGICCNCMDKEKINVTQVITSSMLLMDRK